MSVDSHRLHPSIASLKKGTFLTEEKERELILRYQAGDHTAAHELMQAFIPVLVGMSHGRNVVKNGRVSPRDMFQEACLAMYDSLKLFDVSRGFRFSTHFLMRVRYRLYGYRVKTYTQGIITATTFNRSVIGKCDKMVEDHFRETGHILTKGELAKKLAEKHENKKTPMEIELLLSARENLVSLSHSFIMPSGEQVSLEEMIEDTNADNEDTIVKKIDDDAIGAALRCAIDSGCLKDREKDIMVAIVLDKDEFNNMSFRKLGLKHGISHERVRQLHNDALKKIRKWLLDNEPELYEVAREGRFPKRTGQGFRKVVV